MIVGAGQGFPARMDPTGGGGAKKFFLENSPETVKKCPKPLIFQGFKKFYGGGLTKGLTPC
jgi:hypothetical protein